MNLKANSKYTAGEILAIAKEGNPVNQDAKFGEIRIIIGGISGISSEDHVISIPASSTELEVIIGVDSVTIPLEPAEEMQVSESVKAVATEEGAKRQEQEESVEPESVEPIQAEEEVLPE